MRKALDFERIISAAAELIEEKGFDKVTLSNIAERLGVKPPSLYNHLNGLSDVSDGLSRLGIYKMDEVIRNAAVGKNKDEALMAMALAFRQFALQNPELYKAILKYPRYTDGEIHETGQGIARVIYQVLREYHLSEEQLIHYSRAFRSALHGFVSLEEANFFTKNIDLNESYRFLVVTLITSLQKAAGK
jgi:AcrR family transcriptional regulator